MKDKEKRRGNSYVYTVYTVFYVFYKTKIKN